MMDMLILYIALAVREFSWNFVIEIIKQSRIAILVYAYAYEHTK